MGTGLAVLSFFLLWLAFRVQSCLPLHPSPTAHPLTPEAALRANPLPLPSFQPPRAALVDQVEITRPNPELVQIASHHLQTAGFQVDLYPSDEVTVEFYRTLPSKGYQLVVLRTHSTSDIVLETRSASNMQNIEKVEQTMYERVALFTSERYSEARWLPEQLRTEVGGGSIEHGDQGTLYFGILSGFVRERMAGRFDDTLVIIAGCQSLATPDLAQAFLERGASVVIGWDGWVDSNHNDRTLARLLEALLVEGRTVDQAVAVTMAEVGADPVYQSVLTYYPWEQGNWTVQGQVLGVLGQESDEDSSS